VVPTRVVRGDHWDSFSGEHYPGTALALAGPPVEVDSVGSNSIVYIIGAIVVIVVVLRLFGLF
jgi:hypothetical protein